MRELKANEIETISGGNLPSAIAEEVLAAAAIGPNHKLDDPYIEYQSAGVDRKPVVIGIDAFRVVVAATL
jgi:hypothetical protein